MQMDIWTQETRDTKVAMDLAGVWPMRDSRVRAGEGGIRNRAPITKNLSKQRTLCKADKLGELHASCYLGFLI